MKKTISTLVIGSMLMSPISVLAATDENVPAVNTEGTVQTEGQDGAEGETAVSEDENALHILDFSKIAEEIENRNPTLKATVNDIELLKKQQKVQKDSLEDAKDLEIDTYAMKFGMTDPDRVERRKDYYDDKYDEKLDRLKIEQSLTLSKTEATVRASKDTTIASIQKLFLQSKQLEDQIANLKGQYELLQNKHKILNLQKNLGIVTASNVQTLEASMKELKDSITTLEQTITNLKGGINVALGQDFNTELTLGPKPQIDRTKLQALEYDKDYQVALENNNGIFQADLAYKLQEHALGDKDLTRNQEDVAKLNLDNITVKLDTAKQNLPYTFEKTYKALKEKEDLLKTKQEVLATKQTDWNHKELQYHLGLLSKLDYDQAKQDYDSALLAYNNAQQDLFTAFLDYEWLLKGVDVAVSAAF